MQLRAKQKLKGYYGNITEKQFSGSTGSHPHEGRLGRNLIGLLERRLDMIYRAKFVPTVFAARQLVNHGHVRVNGKRVNIASYRVKVGDIIELKAIEADGAGDGGKAWPSATCRTMSKSTTTR